MQAGSRCARLLTSSSIIILHAILDQAAPAATRASSSTWRQQGAEGLHPSLISLLKASWKLDQLLPDELSVSREAVTMWLDLVGGVQGREPVTPFMLTWKTVI